MRHRRFVVKGLVLLFLMAARTAAIQAQDETSQGIRKTVILVPSSVRRELLETAARLAEVRYKANPHGYERDSPFISEFLTLQKRLDRLLASDAPVTTWSATDMVEGLSSALDAYNANLLDFGQFYAANTKEGGSSSLRSLPASRIAANLLTLYLITQAADPDLASDLKKGSFIWPFCLTKNHVAELTEPGVPAYALLLQLSRLKKEGYSVSFMVEFVNHLKLGEGFSTSEVLSWSAQGIPDEVIRLVLAKIAPSH